MEEKDFHWVLRLLSSSSCVLPVLDTFILTGNNVQTKYFNNTHKQIVKTSLFADMSAKDCFKETLQNYEEVARVKHLGPIVCYYVEQNKRRCLEHAGFKDSMKKLEDTKVSSIQVALPQTYGAPKLHYFSISYTPGGYIPTLSTTKASKSLFSSAKDIMNVLVRYIEIGCKKRVLSLEVDLFEDEEQIVWLGRVVHCRIISQKELNVLNISSLNDLNLIRKKTVAKFSRLSLVKKDPLSSQRRFSEKKTPVLPLKIISPNVSLEDSTSSTEFLKDPEQSRPKPEDPLSRPQTLKNIDKNYIELVCKTELAKKKKKYEEITEEDIRRESQEIKRKLLNHNRASGHPQPQALEDIDSDGSVCTTWRETDNVERAINTRSPFPIYSRSYKTPEQAYHATPKPLQVAKPIKKPKRPKINLHQEFIRQREAYLTKKHTENVALPPILSPNQSCRVFRPIRIVKKV